jgi:uncharacterized RDD family membrane protein YckC
VNQNHKLTVFSTTFFRRIAAQVIDLALWYFLFLPTLYKFINADKPMAYDRLFNGLTEFLLSIPLWIMCTLLLEWASGGYSAGKLLMGLRVRRLNGRRVGLPQVLLRWLGNWPDIYLTAGLGALFAIRFTPSHQRLGDLLANTTVVRVPNVFK